MQKIVFSRIDEMKEWTELAGQVREILDDWHVPCSWTQGVLCARVTSSDGGKAHETGDAFTIDTPNAKLYITSPDADTFWCNLYEISSMCFSPKKVLVTSTNNMRFSFRFVRGSTR